VPRKTALALSEALPDNFYKRFEGRGPNGELFDLCTAARRYLTDPEWQAIKTSLGSVDVDADTVTVTVNRYGKEFSLRDGLAIMAWRCGGAFLRLKFVPTAKEVAKAQDCVLELCYELKTALAHSNYNSLSPDPKPEGDPLTRLKRFPELAEPASHLEAALRAFTAELERCRKVVAAGGDGRGKGNATVHRLFWKELVDVWRANLGKDIHWGMRTNHLESFIIACSGPFFPEETTDTAVRNFVKDLPAFR